MGIRIFVLVVQLAIIGGLGIAPAGAAAAPISRGQPEVGEFCLSFSRGNNIREFVAFAARLSGDQLVTIQDSLDVAALRTEVSRSSWSRAAGRLGARPGVADARLREQLASAVKAWGGEASEGDGIAEVIDIWNVAVLFDVVAEAEPIAGMGLSDACLDDACLTELHAFLGRRAERVAESALLLTLSGEARGDDGAAQWRGVAAREIEDLKRLHERGLQCVLAVVVPEAFAIDGNGTVAFDFIGLERELIAAASVIERRLAAGDRNAADMQGPKIARDFTTSPVLSGEPGRFSKWTFVATPFDGNALPAVLQDGWMEVLAEPGAREVYLAYIEQYEGVADAFADTFKDVRMGRGVERQIGGGHAAYRVMIVDDVLRLQESLLLCLREAGGLDGNLFASLRECVVGKQEAATLLEYLERVRAIDVELMGPAPVRYQNVNSRVLPMANVGRVNLLRVVGQALSGWRELGDIVPEFSDAAVEAARGLRARRMEAWFIQAEEASRELYELHALQARPGAEPAEVASVRARLAKLVNARFKKVDMEFRAVERYESTCLGLIEANKELIPADLPLMFAAARWRDVFWPDDLRMDPLRGEVELDQRIFAIETEVFSIGDQWMSQYYVSGPGKGSGQELIDRIEELVAARSRLLRKRWE